MMDIRDQRSIGKKRKKETIRSLQKQAARESEREAKKIAEKNGYLPTLEEIAAGMVKLRAEREAKLREQQPEPDFTEDDEWTA